MPERSSSGMMRQLPLDVRLADHAIFETWFAGSNDACVHALREVATIERSAVVWVWGPRRSGRSHLLQACVAAADAAGQPGAYLPLAPDLGLAPAMAEGLDALPVVAVDDVDLVAGDAAWERALLLLYEGVRQRGGRLVMAAGRAPLHCDFRLPDLVSRCSSGATFRLHALDDEQRVAAMQLRANWRGLELPDDVARYLVARVARDSGHLFGLLDRLDRAALAAQRRLTVPFVREVLAASAAD